MTELLSGIRILDLTHHIAGPFCTKLLADYGADVIKIERPGYGDSTRRASPFAGDVPHPEKSGPFLHLNTNKRGITLNLKSRSALEVFRHLVVTADAVVENFRPGVMERLGIDYQTLSQWNPKIVLTSISNFGLTGPYKDYKASEITEYATGGSMFATGYPGREPMKLGGNVAQYMAGQAAALATTISLFGVDGRGSGEHLDISIMETQASGTDRRGTTLIAYQFTGRVTCRDRRPSSATSGVQPCADGYFQLAVQTHQFATAMNMLGHPELAEDPRFATLEARAKPEAQDELEPYIIGWYIERKMQDIWAEAQRNGISSAPVYTPKNIVEDQFYKERGFWETVKHPVAGRVTLPGCPFRVDTEQPEPRWPAPTLGQHNEDVISGEIGYSLHDLCYLRRAGIV